MDNQQAIEISMQESDCPKTRLLLSDFTESNAFSN